MADLLDRLVRWEVRPERIVTDRFPLSQAAETCAPALPGTAGKVAIVVD